MLLSIIVIVGLFMALRNLGNFLAPRRPLVILIQQNAGGVPLSSYPPEQAFEIAMQQHGRTWSDLPKLEASAWRRFALFFVMTVCLLTAALQGGFAALICVMLAVTMFAHTAQAALYHYQLRTCRLAGWREFLSKPAEWWPLSPSAGQDMPTLAERWHVLLWRLRGRPAAPVGSLRLTYDGAEQIKKLMKTNTKGR